MPTKVKPKAQTRKDNKKNGDRVRYEKGSKQNESTHIKPSNLRPLQLANSSMVVGSLADATPIIEFLESFQELVNPQNKLPMRLISIKIPEPLLSAFRFKADRAGIPYQTMIKRLMTEWLGRGDIQNFDNPIRR
jgi:hypothetical protein